MDLISKNATFNLKIDRYRRESTVHHHENKQKLGKGSYFSNKKTKKRSFSFISANRKNRALNSYVRRGTGEQFLVICSNYTPSSTEDIQIEKCQISVKCPWGILRVRDLISYNNIL